MNEIPMKQAVVVSAFPGVGKTTLAMSRPDLKILDIDDKPLRWMDAEKKVKNSEWPKNLVAIVRENLDTKEVICVAFDSDVRAALRDAEIPIAVAYPDPKTRDEYLARYRGRSAHDVVDRMTKNFDGWIREIANDRSLWHVTLVPGQFLFDVITKALLMPRPDALPKVPKVDEGATPNVPGLIPSSESSNAQGTKDDDDWREVNAAWAAQMGDVVRTMTCPTCKAKLTERKDPRDNAFLLSCSGHKDNPFVLSITPERMAELRTQATSN